MYTISTVYFIRILDLALVSDSTSSIGTTSTTIPIWTKWKAVIYWTFCKYFRVFKKDHTEFVRSLKLPAQASSTLSYTWSIRSSLFHLIIVACVTMNSSRIKHMISCQDSTAQTHNDSNLTSLHWPPNSDTSLDSNFNLF